MQQTLAAGLVCSLGKRLADLPQVQGVQGLPILQGLMSKQQLQPKSARTKRTQTKLPVCLCRACEPFWLRLGARTRLLLGVCLTTSPGSQVPQLVEQTAQALLAVHMSLRRDVTVVRQRCQAALQLHPLLCGA